MPMKVTDFKPVHGLALLKNFAQSVPDYIVRNIETERFAEIASCQHAYSGFDDGELFVCAGIMPIWPGSWRAWAMIGQRTTARQMLTLHRNVSGWLKRIQTSDDFRRIETTARADSPAALRWLAMLGFECEGHLRRYDADGNDHKIFSRIACHSKLQPSEPA